MEIKNISGKVLLSVPVTDSAVIIEELMKQYSITLNWDAIENVELPLGAYIEHKNIKYSLLAPYQPQQRDEVTFEYKPEFQHPIMRWQYLPFLFYTYSNDKVVSKEPDWSLTDNAANFMAVLCDVIKEQTGEDWTYEVADNLPASASLSFSNKDIFSALNDIANAFETEWWFDYTNKVLYLSKASHGTEVALEVGNNISVPSVTQSKEGYYTRFLVFGSTRNIEQEYKGANTNSIVNKRLTLNPAKYPDGYIDIRNGLTNEEILTKTLVFDDIYPRSALAISDVKVRLMWRLDSNDEKIQIGTDASGKPVYDQYAIWYFKIPNLSFNKDMVISGKVLSVHFNDGPLQGREFELTYHDVAKDVETADGTSIRIDAGSFEINFIEEGSYIIPSITGLVPADGNKVTLFNILMPEEYKASAYEELEKAAQEEIAKQSEDMSNYSFSSNPIEFFTSNPNLTVGQKVIYKNGDYSYSTRVIKLETQLDRPYEQKITIGNEQIKGNTQTLKEEVVSANQNIDLISAINESTQQLVQSYQRTQKALQESMAKWGNMWRLDAENNAVYTPLNMIVEGTLAMGSLGEGGSETPVAGLQKVSITIPNYDNPFVSDAAGNVTLPAYPTALKNPHALIINNVPYDGSKEITINLEGGGGIADSVAWENVMGRPTKLSEFENDVPYATQKWVTDKGYLTSHQDISHLLSKQDAVTTYATIASLNAISDSVSGLRTEFDALNTLLNDDTSGVIDTWNEVVAFLNGYADSQDLATILSGMNTEIGKRAYQTDLDTAVGRIQAIENAYVNKASNQTITGVKTFSNGLKIGDVKLEWDSANQALKIIGNAYVTELFSVGKISESGSGGGGTASAAVRIMLGETPYDAVNGVVNLPAYPSLAGYATESWVNNKGYLTSVSWSDVSSKPNTLAGYGITDAFRSIRVTNVDVTNTTTDLYGYWGAMSTHHGINSVYHHILNFDWNNDLDNWISQLALPTGHSTLSKNQSIHYRSKHSAKWSDWVKVLDVNNYTDYVYTEAEIDTKLADYILKSNAVSAGAESIDSMTTWSDANPSYVGSVYEGSVWKNVISVRHRNGASDGTNYGMVIYSNMTGSSHLVWRQRYSAGWDAPRIILDSTNYSDYALPLGGGTIEGNGAGLLVVNRKDGNPVIGFSYNGTLMGRFGFDTSGNAIGVVGGNQVNLIHSGNYSSYALPLSGGIIKGGVRIERDGTILACVSTSATTPYINFRATINGENTDLGDLGVDTSKNLVFYNGGAWRTIIHAGNANKADVSWTASNILFPRGTSATWNVHTTNGDYKGLTVLNTVAAKSEGAPDEYAVGLSVSGYYGFILASLGGYDVLQYRRRTSTNNTSWKTIAFTDSNVASADYATNAGNAEKVAGFPITSGTNKPWNSIPAITPGGYMDVGKHFEFHYDNTTGSDFSTVLGCTGNYGNIVSLPSVSGTLALLTDNVASATKLQTARTIWGQSFDGSGNINGHLYLSNNKSIFAKNTDGNDKQLLVLDNGNNLVLGYGPSAAGYNTYLEGNSIYFRYGSSHTLGFTLSSSGNVLIGATTDSGYKFDVDGTSRAKLYYAKGLYAYGSSWNSGAGGLNVIVPNDSGQTPLVVGYRADTSPATAGVDRLFALELLDTGAQLRYSWGGTAKHTFYNNGNADFLGRLAVTGDIISEGTMAMARLASSSDAKLKENIKWLSADKSMEVVRALRPTEWDWKKDNTHSFGFIAQDVQPIVPEMVSSVNDTLRLEYNQLHAFEIGAIQHIDSEVEILKRRVTELENQLNEYRRNAQWQ